MSEPKFKPGPWRVYQGKQQSLTIRCGTQVLAEIPGYGVGERLNNAHLIAAAPELYKALMTVQYQCEIMANADWSKWEELASPEEFERWAKSRAAHMAALAQDALAKARGEG